MPPQDNAQSKLVLISSGSDHWLHDARDKVDIERHVSDEATVVSRIETRLSEATELTSIQLISHSVAKPDADLNRLKIGDWIVRDNAFQSAKSLKDKLAQRGSPPIYVVGCLTTVGAVARNTLRAIETTLGVRVFGAKRVVGLYDLDKNGALLDYPDLFERLTADAPRPPYAINGQSLIKAGAKVRPFGPGAVADLTPDLSDVSRRLVEGILSVLNPSDYYEFPGMLTLPTATAPMYAGAGTQIGHIDELFRAQLVRITRRLPEGPPGLEYLLPVDDRWQRHIQALLRGETS